MKSSVTIVKYVCDGENSSESLSEICRNTDRQKNVNVNVYSTFFFFLPHNQWKDYKDY